MKMTSKTWKLVLTGMTALSLLAGCGSASDTKSAGTKSTEATAVNKEGFPIMNEPITLTMMAPDVGVQNWKDMIVFAADGGKDGNFIPILERSEG